MKWHFTRRRKTIPTKYTCWRLLVKHHSRSAGSYFSICHIRRGMTNTSPTIYCICWVTILSMSERLKSAIAVFVFEQSDLTFLCVSAIHTGRMICKDYVMICLSILYNYTVRFSLHQVPGSQCTKEYYTKYSWRTLADVCMVGEVLRVVPRCWVLL